MKILLDNKERIPESRGVSFTHDMKSRAPIVVLLVVSRKKYSTSQLGLRRLYSEPQIIQTPSVGHFCFVRNYLLDTPRWHRNVKYPS